MTVKLKPNKNTPPGGIIVAFILLCSAISLYAQDFGLMLRQTPVLTGGGASNAEENAFSYAATAIPWFAAPLGQKADLYLSGGISAELANDQWKPVPDVYRFEFIYNPTPDIGIEVGRVPFKENLSYVFSGLFDGAAARFNLAGGWLNAGIFYTGLLYKKTAYIVMGEKDRQNYYDEDVYFSSRRLVFGINWEKTSIFATRTTLSLSGLGQFDLNDKPTKLHSQYIEGRLDIPLGSSLSAQAGGVFELIEHDQLVYAAFAISTDFRWLTPTPWRDAVTVRGRLSSGHWNDSLVAFLPVTSQGQGKVLRPELSGIALAQASYTARFHDTFSTDFSAIYFFKTDETSYTDPDMEGSSRSPLLGGELYGSLIWAPFSDLSISAGGGAFFPQWGRYFKKSAEPRYLITLEVVFSF
jgi:hypothetical protein